MRNGWYVVLVLLAVTAGGTDSAGQVEASERFVYSEPVMGTEFRIVLYSNDADRADRAAAAAFARAHDLDSLLSDWRTESPLSRLSRMAGSDACVPAIPDLVFILLKARQISEVSEGSFDVTIGPLSRLWRWAMRRGQLPSESRLAAARAAVGYQKLVIDPMRQCVRLTVPEMKLDLGAIAKGYAADEMLEVVASHGLPAALIDAGGDIVCGDSPPGTTGWVVETRMVDASGRQTATDERLSGSAIATSGDRHRYLDAEGIRYSHLIDPRTGFGITQQRHVTVVAPSGVEADAFASAISVMGRSGLHLVDRPGYGARILETVDGRTQVVATGTLRD